MNYNQIYQRLISRGQSRSSITEYSEKHHIVPRCLGGTNAKQNIVRLTGREHYIAHLCLVKIHPGHFGIVQAAMLMCCESSGQDRSHNRRYSWLRKKHAVAMSVSQGGFKNSQTNTSWVFNETLRENKKIPIQDVASHVLAGWVKGRCHDFDHIYQTCECCGGKFKSSIIKKSCSKECQTILKGKFKPFLGRENELKLAYEKTKSMNKALQTMGFPGAVSHYYHWAKAVLATPDHYKQVDNEAD